MIGKVPLIRERKYAIDGSKAWLKSLMNYLTGRDGLS